MADEQPKKEEKVPSYSDEQIAIYAAFKEHVLDAKSVFYPCCQYDASPEKVFPGTTFVDIEDKRIAGAMEMFRRHGLRAFKMDVADYRPEELHDLLILLNPAIHTSRAIHTLRKGGFVLANNYHENASQMRRNPEMYEIWGTIDFVVKGRRKEGDNRVVVSRNLEGLFEPVSDFEELRRLRPSTHLFIAKGYPHLLRQEGLEPGGTVEETYRRYQRFMGKPETFPAKRAAERYIFTKK
jgi:hypothetical protein